MNINSRRISVIVVFAALYAVGVIFLAPISFGVYQVRLADALLPLSMIFGLPCAIGVSLGNIVANAYGGLGVIDIVGGTAANFVACTLAWYIAKRRGITYRFLGSVVETIVITLIVGGYLAFLFAVPILAAMVGVLVGSIVAIILIGFPIEEAIRRNRSMNERVVDE